MQIKTSVSYYFSHSRMTIIKKTDSKCWQGYGEIAILIRCWWECKGYTHFGKQFGIFLKC